MRRTFFIRGVGRFVAYVGVLIALLGCPIRRFEGKNGRLMWAGGLCLLVSSWSNAYAANFEMAADTMFYQPSVLTLKNAAENKVGKERLVIGVEVNGQARAYPIQYIGYHHQVRDTLGGKPIIVTYCTVCRTGRAI
jgi:hypothetical protein